ncbi:MAG: hypothetical protein U0487_03330 [Patescibacteria group bacterium]
MENFDNAEAFAIVNLDVGALKKALRTFHLRQRELREYCSDIFANPNNVDLPEHAFAKLKAADGLLKERFRQHDQAHLEVVKAFERFHHPPLGVDGNPGLANMDHKRACDEALASYKLARRDLGMALADARKWSSLTASRYARICYGIVDSSSMRLLPEQYSLEHRSLVEYFSAIEGLMDVFDFVPGDSEAVQETHAYGYMAAFGGFLALLIFIDWMVNRFPGFVAWVKGLHW